MRMKIFCVVVLCACLFIACEKDNDDYEPVKPPVEQPENPVEPEKPEKPAIPPSTDDIINVKIGDLNMIVGSEQWNAITYGNGRYVAVGTKGYVTYSDDGVNWSTPKQINSIITVCSCIVYAIDKFVVCGQKTGSDYNGCIAYSSDGINWSKPKAVGEVGSWWKEIAYANEKFVGIGNGGWIICSSDGINWGKAERITDESGKEITTNFYGVCAVH